MTENDFRDRIIESSLTPNARLVCYVLLQYRNRKTGDCYPSQVTIASSCGLCRNSISRAIKELDANGYLSVKKKRMKGQKFTSCFYIFDFQCAPDEQSNDVLNDVSNECAPDEHKPSEPIEPSKDDVVLREEGKRHVLIGKRISKITGWENDPSWFGNYARIEMWISNGWDEELDIIPTIESIMAKRNGDPPSTLNYFEKAIASTHVTRTKPLPQGEIKNDKRSERLRLRAESEKRVLARAEENERKRQER